jgi:Domain of unknown function (DUF4397)
MRTRSLFSLAAAPAAVLLIVGCGGTTAPGDAAPSAHLRVLHTSPTDGPVDVLVHGQVVISSLAAGSVSAVVAVPAGAQPVSFRRSGSANAASSTLLFDVSDTTTLLTVDSGSVINPWELTDTGAVVPAGRSKLRVVHFARSAPEVLFWRSQPDFPAFTAIMFPFAYRSVSPYLESDAGTWRVFMATAQYAGGVPVSLDTLFMAPTITIPAGIAATVVFMDTPGGGYRTVVMIP